MSHVNAVRLKRQAKRYGITHEEIAAAADVGRTLVSHVLAGRATSRNVVGTTRRLIALKRAQRPAGPHRGASSPAEAQDRTPRSTARMLLRHATGWAGADLEQRLAEVSALRSRART